MVYKIYLNKNLFLHDKNKMGMELFIKNNYIEYTDDINDSDIIFYPSLKNNETTITEFDIYDKKFSSKSY